MTERQAPYGMYTQLDAQGRLARLFTPAQIEQMITVMERMRELAIERGIGQSLRLMFNERGLLRTIEGTDNVRVDVPKKGG